MQKSILHLNTGQQSSSQHALLVLLPKNMWLVADATLLAQRLQNLERACMSLQEVAASILLEPLTQDSLKDTLLSQLSFVIQEAKLSDSPDPGRMPWYLFGKNTRPRTLSTQVRSHCDVPSPRYRFRGRAQMQSY